MMNSPNDAEELFYGTQPSTYAQGDAIFTTLKPESKSAPKELESIDSLDAQAEAEDMFYGETNLDENSSYSVSLKPGIEKLAEAYALTPEQLEIERIETAKAFSNLNLEEQEAVSLHDLFVSHSINIPDEDVVAGWENETRIRLQEKYGDDVGARVELAKEYIADNPKLLTRLNATGLGSHPEVVLTLTEQVWRLRANGRFKGKGK